MEIGERRLEWPFVLSHLDMHRYATCKFLTTLQWEETRQKFVSLGRCRSENAWELFEA